MVHIVHQNSQTPKNIHLEEWHLPDHRALIAKNFFVPEHNLRVGARPPRAP